MKCICQTVLLICIWDACSSFAFQGCPKLLKSVSEKNMSQMKMRMSNQVSRKSFFLHVGSFLGVLTVTPDMSSSLVKGSAPPDGYGRIKKEAEGQTKNIAQAREEANLEIEREKQLEEQSGKSYTYTATNVRYKDMVEGSGTEVENGSSVKFRHRVLRLGKRAYDGISGEGSTIFSYGYGEDDDKEGSTLDAVVGNRQFVAAVDEAIVGMKAGGVRRVLVRPDKGWNKAAVDPQCAPTIDLGKTGTVPGGITFTEGCMDLTLLPAPIGFQAQRKFARRFDEALIAEIEVVEVN